MKRVKLTFEEWSCILSKKQRIQYFDSETIKGYVSHIEIEKVSKPQIWKFNGQNITVCENGFQWLSILPAEEYYCMTAMMNQKRQILLWYIDMIAGQGIGEDGVPYFDDLYLDLVVYPDGTFIEDDRDELMQAWRDGDITAEQVALANKVCEELKTRWKNVDSLSEYTYNCLGLLS